MNSSELDRVLRGARVPERGAEHWEEFPSRVVEGLRARGTSASPTAGRASWPTRAALAWTATFAVACMVLGFLLGDRRQFSRRADAATWLKDETALREVLTLFPNRVRAIVRDTDGVQLVLSEEADVPSSPPLWIEFDDDGRRGTVVTFSGQHIDLAGERVEVLANPQGQITVVGERVFWSSVVPQRSAGELRIRARELPIML